MLAFGDMDVTVFAATRWRPHLMLARALVASEGWWRVRQALVSLAPNYPTLTETAGAAAIEFPERSIEREALVHIGVTACLEGGC